MSEPYREPARLLVTRQPADDVRRAAILATSSLWILALGFAPIPVAIMRTQKLWDAVPWMAPPFALAAVLAAMSTFALLRIQGPGELACQTVDVLLWALLVNDALMACAILISSCFGTPSTPILPWVAFLLLAAVLAASLLVRTRSRTGWDRWFRLLASYFCAASPVFCAMIFFSLRDVGLRASLHGAAWIPGWAGLLAAFTWGGLAADRRRATGDS